jgi:cytochrome c553
MATVGAIAVQAASCPDVSVSREDDVQAPAFLSDTGLYAPGSAQVVDARNRLFSPQYPLWSDGAVKTRWVFLPPGTKIDARDDAAWEFPVGTRFWKEFRFGDRKVETRMLWRATAARWVAVSYIWNDGQTDAVLAPDAGQRGVASVTGSRQHDVPSVGDCLTCHGAKRTEPLGFNPLQLSMDRDPNAIHGEPIPEGALTLGALVAEGLLSRPRPGLTDTPVRINASTALTRSMLGYLSTNCGSCHRGDGDAAAQVPSMRYSDVMRDGDAVARSLVGRTTRWQIPGTPDGAAVLLSSDDPELSAMLVRMRSRSPSSQMPPLGTVLRDRLAVDAMVRWLTTDLAR